MANVQFYHVVERNHSYLVLLGIGKDGNAKVHSQYRAQLIMELVKVYSLPEPRWENGIIIEADIDTVPELRETIEQLISMSRMKRKTFELVQANLNLDDIKDILAPLLVMDRLKGDNKV